MTRLTLRRAVPLDGEVIARLELRSARYESRTYALPPLRDLAVIWHGRIKKPTHAVILACSGEALCGFAALEYPLHDGHLAALYVDPDYFRCGVGRVLTAAAAEAARRDGAETLHLEVEMRNFGAQHFYRALHFKPGSVQSADYLLNFTKEL